MKLSTLAAATAQTVWELYHQVKERRARKIWQRHYGKVRHPSNMFLGRGHNATLTRVTKPNVSSTNLSKWTP